MSNNPSMFDTKIANAMTRTKLKDKEIKLLKERLEMYDRIIISSIKDFTTENKETFEKHKPKVHIYVCRMAQENYAAYNQIQHQITNNDSLLMNNCIKLIEKHIQNYVQNLNVNASKDQFERTSYDEYFKSAEQGWNMHKTHMIMHYFRISVSDLVRMFTQNAANEFFAAQFFDIQKLYAQYLQALIRKNSFQEMTRNPHLKFANNIGSKSTTCTEQKTEMKLAEAIMTKYQIAKRQFQNSLLSLHYEVDNYGSKSESNTIDQCIHIQPPTFNMMKQCDNNNNKQSFRPATTTYINQHKSNYGMKAFRYDPLSRQKY